MQYSSPVCQLWNVFRTSNRQMDTVMRINEINDDNYDEDEDDNNNNNNNNNNDNKCVCVCVLSVKPNCMI